MSRQSHDELDSNGRIFNGFDYNLQVWVKDGVCQNVGNGAVTYRGQLVEGIREAEVRV